MPGSKSTVVSMVTPGKSIATSRGGALVEEHRIRSPATGVTPHTGVAGVCASAGAARATTARTTAQSATGAAVRRCGNPMMPITSVPMMTMSVTEVEIRRFTPTKVTFSLRESANSHNEVPVR